MNLVVCYKEGPVDEYLVEEIRAVWPEVRLINVGQKEIADALLEADYFCGHAKVPVDWDKIVRQNRLRWIQSSAAGMDWCLVPSVIESEIEITTASGALSDQVAEHALALILASRRNLPAFFACQTEKNRVSSDYHSFKRLPTKDLTRNTVGIVGFGGVGRRLSQVLSAFQARILATDLFPVQKPDHVAELWGPDRIDDLLTESDVVILCLPLNDSTRYYFDAEKFRKMKKGALLANVARGPLVRTGDLMEALENGQLCGVVVDVTDPEPLPKDHPLWDAPNVIITPHVGGQAAWRFEAINRLFIENIKRRKAGEPMINRLSPEGKRLGFPLRNGETPLWIK
ncbi:MAG: hypothetical protein FWC43_07355 [Planctomycetaceae bacterium]|nr:hypothetical protein [Planctomycetaceae bacterium]